MNVNKKIKNFFDYTKEVELRLRNLEGTEVDTSITNIETGTGSIVTTGSYICVQRSIGSAMYLHVPYHNLLESPSSLVGDIRAGSKILEGVY